jgi:stage V sporulation protein AF
MSATRPDWRRPETAIRPGRVVRRPSADAARFRSRLNALQHALGYGESYDILVKRFRIGQRAAAVLTVDSMVSETVLTLILEFLTRSGQHLASLDALRALIRQAVPTVETTTTHDLETARDAVLSGPAVFLVEGVDGFLIADVRKYPERAPSEPSLERVMRGPRDGFVETLVFNTVLVRRRIRDPRLRIELFQVGERSKADIALLYVKDIAHPQFVDEMRRRIRSIRVDALTMSEKALEEWLMKKPWWNPFPVSRFTERPDVAAEHLMQGHVLVMADTSPNALIVPVTLFSFLQSAEEYHEGIVVGSYLKWVRTLGMLFSLVGPPLWFVILAAHVHLPDGWGVLVNPKTTGVPIVAQLILAEIGTDLLRLALMFSPDALSQSMGFFGAILLGDIAVKAGILDAEILVYVALAAVGTFAAPDFDFGLALRLWRMVLVLLVAGFDIVHAPWVGLGVGLAGFFLMALNASSLGMSYLWPLLPFNPGELLSALSRRPLNRNVRRPPLTLPKDRRRQPD